MPLGTEQRPDHLGGSGRGARRANEVAGELDTQGGQPGAVSKRDDTTRIQRTRPRPQSRRAAPSRPGPARAIKPCARAVNECLSTLPPRRPRDGGEGADVVVDEAASQV